jgi:1,4-alpha-glucan branching enzyme
MIKREIKKDTVQLTFVLPAGAAPDGRVSVVGDFNSWTPGVHTLVKRSNGTRSVKVPVEPGTSYRFRYLGENGVWFDDPAVETRVAADGVVHA